MGVAIGVAIGFAIGFAIGVFIGFAIGVAARCLEGKGRLRFFRRRDGRLVAIGLSHHAGGCEHCCLIVRCILDVGIHGVLLDHRRRNGVLTANRTTDHGLRGFAPLAPALAPRTASCPVGDNVCLSRPGAPGTGSGRAIAPIVVVVLAAVLVVDAIAAGFGVQALIQTIRIAFAAATATSTATAAATSALPIAAVFIVRVRVCASATHLDQLVRIFVQLLASLGAHGLFSTGRLAIGSAATASAAASTTASALTTF